MQLDKGGWECQEETADVRKLPSPTKLEREPEIRGEGGGGGRWGAECGGERTMGVEWAGSPGDWVLSGKAPQSPFSG